MKKKVKLILCRLGLFSNYDKWLKCHYQCFTIKEMIVTLEQSKWNKTKESYHICSSNFQICFHMKTNKKERSGHEWIRLKNQSKTPQWIHSFINPFFKKKKKRIKRWLHHFRTLSSLQKVYPQTALLMQEHHHSLVMMHLSTKKSTFNHNSSWTLGSRSKKWSGTCCDE